MIASEFAYQQSLWPRYCSRQLEGTQVFTDQSFTSGAHDEEEWHDAQEVFPPPSPAPAAAQEQPPKKSGGRPLPPSILQPPRNPCQPNSWPDASCYVLPPVLPLLPPVLPSDAVPKARITLWMLQRACDQLREMVGTPGPTPLRLVAVQQGRVLADEEVADMPANASAIGINVPADELRSGVVYVKVLVKPELTSQPGPLKIHTFASMPVLVLPPSAGVEMEDLFGAMIHTVRKEELEVEISRGRCVRGDSKDVGYADKLRGGRHGTDSAKPGLNAEMLHGGIKRCSSESFLSRKGVGANCRWGDRQRFKLPSSTSSSSVRASTDTSKRLSAETCTTSNEPQIDVEMDSMLLEQAQQISDALGPDDVSEGGLQLEELPPSSPSFLLETGGSSFEIPPPGASPESFHDLPPPSPLRRFSLDAHELEPRFQEVNRRSSMGSVAICGHLLAARGYRSLDSVVPQGPAPAYLSSSLYKPPQQPPRPSTRIPGSTRLHQPAQQPPSAAQYPQVTPRGRSLVSLLPQMGRQSPASAAAPTGSTTSIAGSEASGGSGKPRGRWLGKSSPTMGSEHSGGAGQQQQQQQQRQPAGAEQQRVEQKHLEVQAPVASPAQPQGDQQARERTAWAGVSHKQQGLVRQAPAGARDKQQGMESRAPAGPKELSPASQRAAQARQELLLRQQQEHKQHQEQERQQEISTAWVSEPISAPISEPLPPATPLPATPYGAPMDAQAQLLLPRPYDPDVVLSKAQEPLPRVSKSHLSLQDQHHPTAGVLAASLRSLIYASSPSLVASAYSTHFGALSADLGFCLEAADHCNACRAVAAATGAPMPVCLSSIELQREWSTRGGPLVALEGTDASLVVATLKDLDTLLSSRGMVACRDLLSVAAEQMQDPAG